MTAVAFLLLSLTAVCAVVDWIAVSAGQRVIEYVCKPLVMVGLVAAALQLDPSSDLARNLLVCGLILSLIGDVSLMLPSDAFVAGLMAFLGAHLFYGAAMVALGLDLGAVLFGAVLAAVIGVFVARRIVAGEHRDSRCFGEQLAHPREIRDCFFDGGDVRHGCESRNGIGQQIDGRSTGHVV